MSTGPYGGFGTYVIGEIDSLKDEMHAVLETIEQTFNQAGIVLPDRRYVAHGQTAWDCEQLTVSLVQIFIGPVGDLGQVAQTCEAPRTAALLVQLVRCVPTVNGNRAPSEQSLIDAADAQARDAWMLLESASNYVSGKGGFGHLFASIEPSDPQGRYQAMQLNLSVQVG